MSVPPLTVFADLAAQMPPHIAARFELQRLLGRGAFASVFLARDRAHVRQVALKTLPPGRGPSARRELAAEARLAASLAHPGVIRIHDWDEQGGWVSMEPAQSSLRDHALAEDAGEARGSPRLSRHRPARASVVLAQIATELWAVLCYLDGHGVAHGDVTPRNVLVCHPLRLVLADFGAARSPAHAEGGPVTPRYAAPELFAGAAPSHAADLFSLGAVLWELALGSPLRSHADLVAGQLRAPPWPKAQVHDVDDALKAFIIALLQPEPTPRLERAHASVNALLVDVEASGQPCDSSSSEGDVTNATAPQR